jgi:hypothetical protein
MAKKTPTTAMVASKIKDTAPELDDVRKIVIQNHEQPTPYEIGLIEGMASHMIPADEICSIIRISRGRFDKHLEYQEAFQRGTNLGKASLRRMQMVSAKSNPVMQIWMGKQYLGQADKVEAPQGESQLDAYTGFLNKLNLTINVSTEGKPAPTVVGAGKGDSEVLLETVGKDSATPTEPRRVAGAAEDTQVDRRVGEGREEPGKSFLGQLEDMVISSGSGKRKDESRSRVG